MKKIMIAILLMTCSAPQPLVKSGNPDVRKVVNRIKIRGDSNVVNFHYYRIYGANKQEVDSIKQRIDTIK